MTDRITRADVNRLAETCGVHVATWSPGDGMTRYHFTQHASGCMADATTHCGCLDYFGASGSSNLGTALGAKEAYVWLQGFRAARFVFDTRNLTRQHELNAHS